MEICEQFEPSEALTREPGFIHWLLESMADGVIACDADGRLTLFNHTAREWFGGDLVGISLDQWASHHGCCCDDASASLPPEEVPLVRAFRGEKITNEGMAIVTPGRPTRFFRVNGGPVQDTQGMKLGAVVVMEDVTKLRRGGERTAEPQATDRRSALRDITGHRRNEAINALRLHLLQFAATHSLDELLEETLNETEKQAQEKMLRSEQRLRLHLEKSPLGFLEWDDHFCAIEWNAACERIFGYTRQEAIGRHAKDLILPVEVHGLVDGIYESLMNQTADQHNINENITKDGRIIVCEWFCTTLVDKDGRAIGVASICRDITEQKKAEDELSRYREQLEEMVKERTAELEAANKELEAFAYSVSHDLRAPLRHINGFLELLQKRAGKAIDPQGRHYMDTISDEARKMGLLIDDLLSFSRMGRQAMSFKKVALEPLVHDVIRELEPDAAGRNITWRIGDLPAVGGDAAMLRMVMTNLISNALKFTRPRRQARIEIGSANGQASETVIFVRDNGVGFDMTYVDKLFAVFQRLHHAEEFEGTGIGLASVRRIIARHNGRTWAKGKVDRGAAFYFSLPWHAKGEHAPERTRPIERRSQHG
jgi:PAS domain S-box-containing protein